MTPQFVEPQAPVKLNTYMQVLESGTVFLRITVGVVDHHIKPALDYTLGLRTQFRLAGWEIVGGMSYPPAEDGGIQFEILLMIERCSAKWFYEQTHSGSLAGMDIILPDGRRVQVERHNGYVLSGFDIASHSWWAIDLRNDHAEVPTQ